MENHAPESREVRRARAWFNSKKEGTSGVHNEHCTIAAQQHANAAGTPGKPVIIPVDTIGIGLRKEQLRNNSY